MQKLKFIPTLILSLVFLLASPYWHALEEKWQLIFAISCILFLGVPHGALDHVLWFKKNKKMNSPQLIKFLVKYVSLILLYTAAWLIFPYISLVFFFLMSFYHFGQSQLSFLPLKEGSWLKSIIYVFWGASLISALFYHHYDFLINYFNETSHFAKTANIITPLLLYTIACIAGAITVLFIVNFEKNLWRELGIFFFLHITFYLLPPLIAFTLYFTLWHSLIMLIDEYFYLQKENVVKSTRSFLNLLMPTTVVSIVGAVFLLLFFSLNDFQISPFFLIIIFLSVLTLPHSWVMNRFYQLKEK